jgi:hypothetical protein
MTIAIAKEVHEVIKKHPEIKWSQVARTAIEEKAALLKKEADPWKLYAYKRWAEEGEDAEKLFKF